MRNRIYVLFNVHPPFARRYISSLLSCVWPLKTQRWKLRFFLLSRAAVPRRKLPLRRPSYDTTGWILQRWRLYRQRPPFPVSLRWETHRLTNRQLPPTCSTFAQKPNICLEHTGKALFRSENHLRQGIWKICILHIRGRTNLKEMAFPILCMRFSNPFNTLDLQPAFPFKNRECRTKWASDMKLTPDRPDPFRLIGVHQSAA